VDNLAAVANLIADFDIVSTLLSGLSPEYDSFITFVNTRVALYLSEELIDLMLSQEIYRGRVITTPNSIALMSPFTIYTASRASSYHSALPFPFRGRGHGRGRSARRGYSFPSL